MKSRNTSLVSVGAAMALVVGLSACAPQEVVTNDSTMASPRMTDASQPVVAAPDTTATAMPPAAATTATAPAPMSMEPAAPSTANTYSGSTTATDTPMASANRSDSEQAPARVDRN